MRVSHRHKTAIHRGELEIKLDPLNTFPVHYEEPLQWTVWLFTCELAKNILNKYSELI